MANEQEEVMDSETDGEEQDLDSEETQDAPAEEKPKPKETPQAKLARLDRQAAQLRKKLGVEDMPREQVREESKSKSSELDYGEKAFLRSYDIKGPDELNLVKNWRTRTGDELDAIVEDEIFTAKLQSLRNAKASLEAVPKGTKRSSTGARNDVDMAFAKYKTSGEMPTDPELRGKVFDEMLKSEKNNSQFYNS